MLSRDGHATDTGRDHAQSLGALTPLERACAVLSALWIAGMVPLFLWGLPSDGSGGTVPLVMGLIGCLMLPAMVWAGLIALRAIRIIREETARLEAAIDALHILCADPRPVTTVADGSVLLKLDEIAAAQRDVETRLAKLCAARDPVAEPSPPAPDPVPPANAVPPADDVPPANDAQVTLPLGIPAEEPQAKLARSDFIKALNFPQNMDDTAGFTALRRAMIDRPAAQVIRAAQDILTLMSQDGIYMDDLAPDMAHPDLWRRFASGERGPGIAALGGVRDPGALDAAATRMKQDAIFRDVAHHFLRLFDRMFTDFAQTATDAEIAGLAETRTARAFMLLGRVAGIFD